MMQCTEEVKERLSDCTLVCNIRDGSNVSNSDKQTLESKPNPPTSRTVYALNFSTSEVEIKISHFQFWEIIAVKIPPQQKDSKAVEIDGTSDFITIKIYISNQQTKKSVQRRSCQQQLFSMNFVHTRGRPIVTIHEDFSVSQKYNYYPDIEPERCPADGILSHQIDITDIVPGDHIYVWNGVFQHHGIATRMECSALYDESEWRVIHFSPGKCVEDVALKDFANGKAICRAQYGESKLSTILKHGASYQVVPLPSKEVVLNAERMRQLKWSGYHLMYNNSESFAFYCKTGKLWSRQASEHANKLAPGAGAGAVIGSIGGVVMAEEGFVLAGAVMGGVVGGLATLAVVGLLGLGGYALARRKNPQKRNLQMLLEQTKKVEEQRHQELMDRLKQRVQTRWNDIHETALQRASDGLIAIFGQNQAYCSSSRKNSTENADLKHTEELFEPAKTNLHQLCNLLSETVPSGTNADELLLFLEELICRTPAFNFFKERYILWSELGCDQSSEYAYILCCLEMVIKNLSEHYGIEYPEVEDLANMI